MTSHKDLGGNFKDGFESNSGINLVSIASSQLLVYVLN